MPALVFLTLSLSTEIDKPGRVNKASHFSANADADAMTVMANNNIFLIRSPIMFVKSCVTECLLLAGKAACRKTDVFRRRVLCLSRARFGSSDV